MVLDFSFDFAPALGKTARLLLLNSGAIDFRRLGCGDFSSFCSSSSESRSRFGFTGEEERVEIGEEGIGFKAVLVCREP